MASYDQIWLKSVKCVLIEPLLDFRYLFVVFFGQKLVDFCLFPVIPANTGIDSGIEALIPNTGIENKSVFWKL